MLLLVDPSQRIAITSPPFRWFALIARPIPMLSETFLARPILVCACTRPFPSRWLVLIGRPVPPGWPACIARPISLACTYCLTRPISLACFYCSTRPSVGAYRSLRPVVCVFHSTHPIGLWVSIDRSRRCALIVRSVPLARGNFSTRPIDLRLLLDTSLWLTLFARHFSPMLDCSDTSPVACAYCQARSMCLCSLL